MQVPTIDIDRDEARKRVAEFTAKRRKKLTEMDQALFRGYRALAEGLTLIDVNQAIKQGGHFDDNYCPKLAMARSDVETVFFNHHWHYYGQPIPHHGGDFAAYSTTTSPERRGKFWEEVKAHQADNQGAWAVSEHLGLMQRFDDLIDSPEDVRRGQRRRWHKSEYQTVVPPIPFHLRPNGDAASYFILWEVEKWEEFRAARAPGDPFLLERIAHPIYVVVAQWDLSELEKRILESFRR